MDDVNVVTKHEEYCVGRELKRFFFALKVEGGESDTVKGFFVKGLNTHVGEQNQAL